MSFKPTSTTGETDSMPASGNESGTRIIQLPPVADRPKVVNGAFQLLEGMGRLRAFAKEVDAFCVGSSWALGVDPTTRKNTHYDLGLFLSYLQDVVNLDIRPENVDRKMIYDFFDWRRSLGSKALTIHRLFYRLRTFFSWMVQEGKLARSPLAGAKMCALPKRLARPMTQEELVRLLDSFQSKKLIDVLDMVIVELLFGTGMRLTEVLHLKKRDLILKDSLLGPHVRFIGKGKHTCLVPLSPGPYAILKAYLERLGDRIVGEHIFRIRLSTCVSSINRNSFQCRFKEHLVRAGLPRKYSPHMLRHSFSTLLFESGMAIEQIRVLLNHRDLESTEGYTKVSVKRLQQIYSAADIRGTVGRKMTSIRGLKISKATKTATHFS